MKLTSLKQNYSELYPAPDENDNSDEFYPDVCFRGDLIKSLGLENAKVGDEMTMTATVRVSEVSQSAGNPPRVEVEILEGGFEKKDTTADAANILFPNG